MKNSIIFLGNRKCYKYVGLLNFDKYLLETKLYLLGTYIISVHISTYKYRRYFIIINNNKYVILKDQ